jgi:hypothetical protein
MAINFGFMSQPQGGEQFLPFVKYDSRAGRMFRVDKKPDGTIENVEISRAFKALVDMENIETGWMHFESGAAPIYALSRFDQPNPPKPVDKAKEGVRLIMQLSGACGGDVREISSNAKVLMQAVSDLHTAYEAGLKDNPGKLPIVTLVDTRPVVTSGKGGTSTNYMPVFEIVGWAPRSAQLVWSPKAHTPVGAIGAASAPQTGSYAPPGASVPPYTGSTIAPPPQPQQQSMHQPTFAQGQWQAPQQTKVAEEDFG